MTTPKKKPAPSLAERATTWIERYTRMPIYFDERDYPTLRAAYFAGYEAAKRDARKATTGDEIIKGLAGLREKLAAGKTVRCTDGTVLRARKAKGVRRG